MFIFETYNEKVDKIQGKWKNGNKVLVVNLEKELDTFGLKEDIMIEIPMFYSTKNEYFWIKVRMGDLYPTSEEILIYDKQTGKLLQTIDMRFGEWCTFIGVTSIEIDDYNFDGILDFSLFGSSFSGPNTISNYFLKNNNEYELAPLYYKTSLSFDKEKKKVYSENVSGGGRYMSRVTFTVKGSKELIPVEHFQLERSESDDRITYSEITSIMGIDGNWIKVKEIVSIEELEYY